MTTNPSRRGVLATVFAGAFALAASAIGIAPAAAQDKAPVRVAMGDIASVESLGLLIAMERAKERGVPMELTFFNSEDVATQAVVGGQADIGVGAPYAFIQNSNAPIRMFYRMSTLLFFPVVHTEAYNAGKDLDGPVVTVHSRGSGTEALMYAGFPDLFGHRHSILIAHALVLLLYATFRIVIRMQRHDAET